MRKKWIYSNDISSDFLTQFPNNEIHPIILKVLFKRGLSDEKSINSFLYPEFDKNLYDPYIFVDMQKACDRIIQAILNKQKILVYGDYDADGVSSSVLMVSVLKSLGGNVQIYIPHREIEGYGIGQKSLEYIIANKFDLVITVDCAISNKKEIDILAQNKIDVIVTDHHMEPLELPNAFAIINPQLSRESYPFKKLAGVGVAFKLAQGLFKMLNEKKLSLNDEYFVEFGGRDGFLKWILDVVSIGTVADCMPLIDENRVFVKYGLKVMRKTKRLGLRELINHSGISIKDLQTYHIGFQIAPRINSAGRLDHANVAYELLMSEDFDKVCELSLNLNNTNAERQLMTEKVLNEAINLIGDIQKTKNIIVVVGDDWIGGIVGLVAGKLVEKYNKPIFVLTRSKGNISGSGRSLPIFDMMDALHKLDSYFLAYGGHKLACGFTLKDNSQIDEFIQKIDELAGEQMKDKDLTPIINVDAELSLKECDWNLIEQLEMCEPFGFGNAEPVFMIKNLIIKECSLIGKTESHMRFVFEFDGITKKSIAFGFGNLFGTTFRAGNTVDIICNLGINEWNGNREIQLKLVDIKFAE